jgi:broad specificity phosphatase PhoE
MAFPRTPRIAPPQARRYHPAMILLRHGQSEFNLHFTATRRDPGIADPRLTELGHAQAAAAAQALQGEAIERIIVSPYTRALETAAPAAKLLGVPVFVNPIVRERYAFSCDIGSPTSQLARDWPHHDFSHLDEIWWPQIEEPAHGIIDRAALFRAEMAALPNWERTLVVSHWGFILCMTGTSAMNGTWLRCDPTTAAPAEISWRH